MTARNNNDTRSKSSRSLPWLFGNQVLKSCSRIGLALIMLVLCTNALTAQNAPETSFRAYPIYDEPVAEAADQLRQTFQQQNAEADVVVDAAGRRLLVNGSDASHRIALEYSESLNPAVRSEPINAPTLSSSELRAYPVPGNELADLVAELRQRYASQPEVRIGLDQRNNQVLVHAPSTTHREINRSLRQDQTPAPVGSNSPGASSTGPALAIQSAGNAAGSRLRNITWQQLMATLEDMTPNKLALTQSSNSRDLEVTLPSKLGQTRLRLNPSTGDYQLDGEDELVRSWARAIGAIDQPNDDLETTQILPIRDKAAATTVTRAVGILQNARQKALAAKVRWGADLVGIETQDSKDKEGFAELREADILAQNDAAPPNEAQPAGEGGDVTTIQLPEGQVGVDGAMIGPVQIEFVEGLDSIIIRGRRPDVERVMKIIDDIERLSIVTEPTIELIPLKHVNSVSMAELVTQLNTQALAARRGTVSITPLVKPNALLLIGREEGVQATVELIERLDQPVAPASQFKIFSLSHMSATDAQQTIETFFEERGGLGPLIQVQADYRTNSLIVYASPRDMQEVGHLIKKIDVNASKTVDEVRVFKLKNALADELAPVLQGILRGEDTTLGRGGGFGQGGGQFQGGQQGGFGQNQNSRGLLTTPRSSMLTLTIDEDGNRELKSGILTNVLVAADERANSLVVTAPADSMDLIAALVKQLDDLPTSEAQIKVFTIINGDAAALAETLAELFGETQQDGPTLQSATGAGESSLVPLRFSVDLRTNSIIATGSSADLGVVEAILLRLDEDDISQRRSRVYRLMNAPALDVATAINEFLRSERDIALVAPDSISPFEQIEREVVVVPEVVSNSLIISSTPRYFDAIEKIVQELDERPPMVMIQVLIAEVALGNVEEFGVELGLQDSLLFDRSAAIDAVIDGGDELAFESGVLDPGFNFNNQPLGNSVSPFSLRTRENVAGQALTAFGLNRISSDLGYGGLVLSASSESVNLLIRALRESRRLDILSRPQVMTLNNQPAFVLVGQRVPYVTSINQGQTGVTSTPVEFQNVGLVLGVTPRISPDGLVVMEIDAEKSKLSENTVTVGISENGQPVEQNPIDTTTLQTTVSARSGQTVILGGLITKDKNSQSRRVPYLADIPVMGDLFRYDKVVEARSELLIIMTPHIVRKENDLEELNQIESERMSWCLADVIDIHGNDPSLTSGGIGGNDAYTEIIYPDLNPTAVPPASDVEQVPTPFDERSFENVPVEPPIPNGDPTSSIPSNTKTFTQRMGDVFSPINSKDEPIEASDVAEAEFNPLLASEREQEYQTFDGGSPSPSLAPSSDDMPVLQAAGSEPMKTSTWNKIRKSFSIKR